MDGMPTNAKLLVVEDDAQNANKISRILTKIGHQVMGIFSSASSELIGSLKKYQPDLLIINLNSEAGYENIKTAQNVRKLFGTPIIFVTDQGQPSLIKKASELQPENIILKPFREKELSIAVQLALFKKLNFS